MWKCLLEHCASVSVRARLHSHLVWAWGKCLVSFEANAHLCPASSCSYRKKLLTSNKTWQSVVKTLSWSDVMSYYALLNTEPDWLPKDSAHSNSIPELPKCWYLLSFISRYFVARWKRLASGIRDWKEAGKYVDQSRRNFQIQYWRHQSLLLI